MDLVECIDINQREYNFHRFLYNNKIDHKDNEKSKLEPTFEEKNEPEETNEESNPAEFSSEEELSEEDFNQETEEELLDIPTLLGNNL